MPATILRAAFRGGQHRGHDGRADPRFTRPAEQARRPQRDDVNTAVAHGPAPGGKRR
ncbi:hypothetical protein P3T36_007076 [Kitasatospora sp. MAP12-15]|uniref:hypothetical protein n=1 Tax=unclassified Kitasatospora TaxID=2633591 RepID=UPI002474BCCF|nr:hypothetical protein [Kitasatospora sp. MAP12-44]MDH6108139.1 hypothetical protein [Kitasatospora sp. MAP12-44]